MAPHGLKALLQPVIDDLKTLETEGIHVEYEGQMHHLFGTISVIADDNLGAHAIGRFYENFSTVHRLCRFCRATKEHFQGIHTDEFPERTKETHNAQARVVERDQTMAPSYGVKGQSCLNQLQFYHVKTD